MISRKEIRILFFGTPEISAYLLEKLLENGYNIVGLVAQEDKPIGRKGIIEPVPTKKVALKFNIPVFQYKKISEHVNEIKAINPDLILTLAFGQIVSHDILMIPKYGCLNLHGSILPKYRGAAPIQYSLLNGDRETGISLMEMVDKMDAGKVYAIERVKIDDEDNFTSLVEKLKIASFDCIEKYLDGYLNGELKGNEQDENLVTYTKKIKEEDEIIDFNNEAKSVFNKIRALSMNPGAHFIFNNIKFKIFKCNIINDNSPKESGTILSYDKKNFIIKCGKDSLKIEQIQKQGKKIMNYSDFYNGNSKEFKIGDLIK